MFTSASQDGSEASVEADVLEVIVLGIVVNGLGKGESLLHDVVTLEFHLSHHIILQIQSRKNTVNIICILKTNTAILQCNLYRWHSLLPFSIIFTT